MRKELLQYFQEFIHEKKYVQKIYPNTILGYEHVVALLFKLVPDLTIETISTSKLVEFFRRLETRSRVVGKGVIKSGVKKSTVATYWTKLNTFFSWLEMKKIIGTNPLTGIPYPSPSYDNRKYLQKHDIEKIITAIHTGKHTLFTFKRNLALLYLFIFCGLRKEEALNVYVQDIDFERNVLTVRGATSKSKLSRKIPLNSIVINHLKDYLSARRKYTTPYLIVSTARDGKLSPDGLKHLIQSLRVRSKVNFHVHQLRHTFAVNFLKASNNIVKLKMLLGHKNISMTLTYLRCMPVDEMREDVELLSIETFL